jgi:hypothetical protein
LTLSLGEGGGLVEGGILKKIRAAFIIGVFHILLRY